MRVECVCGVLPREKYSVIMSLIPFYCVVTGVDGRGRSRFSVSCGFRFQDRWFWSLRSLVRVAAVVRCEVFCGLALGYIVPVEGVGLVAVLPRVVVSYTTACLEEDEKLIAKLLGCFKACLGEIGMGNLKLYVAAPVAPRLSKLGFLTGDYIEVRVGQHHKNRVLFLVDEGKLEVVKPSKILGVKPEELGISGEGRSEDASLQGGED